MRGDVRRARDRRQPPGRSAAAVGRSAREIVSGGLFRSTSRGERVALVLLVLLALAVILVPALASRDPLRIDDVLARRLVPPLASDAHGGWHVLGTDRFGRDMLVRMM